jgi:hypothetical protein
VAAGAPATAAARTVRAVARADSDPVPEPERLDRFDAPAAPPCGRTFYGPCAVPESSRPPITGQARDVEVAAYEPKLNVTPNAVASKG